MDTILISIYIIYSFEYLLIGVALVFAYQTIALHIYNTSSTSVEHGTEHASDLGMTLRDYPERWLPRCRRSWPPGSPESSTRQHMGPVRYVRSGAHARRSRSASDDVRRTSDDGKPYSVR